MSQNLLENGIKNVGIRAVLDEFRIAPSRRLALGLGEKAVERLESLGYIVEQEGTRLEHHFGGSPLVVSAVFHVTRKGIECIAKDYKPLEADVFGFVKIQILTDLYKRDKKICEYKRVDGVVTDLVQLLELGLIKQVGKPRRVNEKVTVCNYQITGAGVRQLRKQLGIKSLTSLR